MFLLQSQSKFTNETNSMFMFMFLFKFQIEGCRKKEHGNFYVGKRCVYVFKAKTRKAVPQKPYVKSRVRAIWGKVTRLHGSTGAVRARFRKNLPGHAMGQRIRIVSISCVNVMTKSVKITENRIVFNCAIERNAAENIIMMIQTFCRHLKPETKCGILKNV